MEKKHLGAETKLASHAIRSYIDKVLAEKLKEKLTGVEGMTMGYFFRHQDMVLTARLVMDRFHITKATASQTLNGLEKKGLISMKPLPGDKRVKRIVLTEKGEAVQAEFKVIFAEINGQIEKGISEADKETFRSVLHKMMDNVGFDCTKCEEKERK
jgi:DNA-binding MarR family transcriptional regulator